MPGVLARLCGWMGLGATLDNELGHDLAPFPGSVCVCGGVEGQTSSGDSQTFQLRT